MFNDFWVHVSSAKMIDFSMLWILVVRALDIKVVVLLLLPFKHR